MSAFSSCKLRDLNDQLCILSQLAIDGVAQKRSLFRLETILRLPETALPINRFPDASTLQVVLGKYGSTGKEGAKSVISDRDEKDACRLGLVLLGLGRDFV